MSTSLQFGHQFNLLQKFYSEFPNSSLSTEGQSYSGQLKQCLIYPKELISQLFTSPKLTQNSTILNGTELGDDITPEVKSMVDKLIQFAGDANYGSIENFTNKDPSDPQYVNWETEMSPEEHQAVLKHYQGIIQAINKYYRNFGNTTVDILYSLITGKKLLQSTMDLVPSDADKLQELFTNLCSGKVSTESADIELIRKYSHIFIYSILQEQLNGTEKQNKFLITLTELLNPLS